VLGRTLNLGILAHVDAGKTTLTERLLYAAGVIDAPGSVDSGTTQTDTLDLERQRGITIKAAVVSFPIAGVTVNLVDTPGHPDFIAEVERVLDVLDGAVLVVSAVEGVQAQTLVLMRALQRLRIPTLVFVNKVDRTGADVERVVAELQARVAPEAVATWAVDLPALAERDAGLLEAYVDGTAVGEAELRHALAAQTAAGLVPPRVRRLRDHRRRRRRTDAWDRRVAARACRGSRRAARRHGLQDRARADGRRSRTPGCSQARCASASERTATRR
jgi:small GTP-binding protein domain